MRDDDCPHNEQTKARASLHPRTSLVRPVGGLEQAGQMFRRYGIVRVDTSVLIPSWSSSSPEVRGSLDREAPTRTPRIESVVAVGIMAAVE